MNQSFNPEQQMAITHGEGPALVIAGPGSGKTAVLTGRIKYLIETYGINPREILVITFSKAAGLEMEERFQRLCSTYYPVNFGTFHSIFFHIICDVYKFNSNNILTTAEKRRFLKTVLKETGIVAEAENELADSILKDISSYKNSNEEIYIEKNNIEYDIFVKIYKEYVHICKSLKKIDFDDMLLVVYRLFKANESILEKYREKYRFILVDECQDINKIQLEIVKLLGGSSGNIFMVGDDDQMIYGFRGADFALLQSFCNAYPNTKKINMSVNYRCSKNIIAAAAAVIDENKNRFAKSIKAGRDREGKFELKEFASSILEEKFLYELIDEYRGRYNSLAIICRTNREASYYGELCRLKNIPVNIREIPFNPYKTKEFVDFYHYFRLCRSGEEADIRDIFHIMNKPVRYMSRSLILSVATEGKISWSRLMSIYGQKSYMKKILNTFRYDMDTLKKMDFYSGINYIRKAMGYDEYVQSNVKTREEYLSYMELADMLQKLMREINSMEELKILIDAEEPINERNILQEAEGINICTFHSSKGLEYDTVILPHVNEGSVPNKNSAGERQIEEERRMLYVAMTRAKERLVITYVKGKHERLLPSRFLYCLMRKGLF